AITPPRGPGRRLTSGEGVEQSRLARQIQAYYRYFHTTYTRGAPGPRGSWGPTDQYRSQVRLSVAQVGNHREVVPPDQVLGTLDILGEADIRDIPRPARRAAQLHATGLQALVALLGVAPAAAADE